MKNTTFTREAISDGHHFHPAYRYVYWLEPAATGLGAGNPGQAHANAEFYDQEVNVVN